MTNPPRTAARAADPSGTPARNLGLASALALALVLLPTVVADPARAQGSDAWVGARVLARESETRLKVGAKVLATLNAGSVFRVERAEGAWLWVDSGNIRGWVKKADVVPFEQAVAYFSGVIRAEPANAHAYLGRGIARHANRDHDGAVADYSEALRLAPKDAWAYHNRSAAHHARRDFAKALADADSAVRLDPAEPAHLANRASTRFALKEYDLALADYSEALGRLKGGEAYLDDSGEEGEPGRTRGRLWAVKWTCARAECWAAKRAFDKAIADYVEALRLDPKDFATANSLAWLLSTCGDSRFRDGRRALDLAARACELTGYRNHLCLDTLATACAESGDFATALHWLAVALDLADGDARYTDGYRARLELFRDGLPYREEP
jgi:tetratricopeptide (TPR) repeat protein